MDPAKPTILYVSRAQFGYMVPTYNNCRYLRQHLNIKMLTLAQNRPPINLEGIEIHYSPFHPSRWARYWGLLKTAARLSRTGCDLVLVEHFPGCFPIPLLGAKVPHVLDIRTGGVFGSRRKRALVDLLLWWDRRFFRRISVISEGLRDRLGYSPSEAIVIPLGADELDLPPKSLSGPLRLLYVGTLSGRRIQDTILGLHAFLRQHPAFKATYDIVGDGWGNERQELQQLVGRLGLQKVIRLHGFIHLKDLLGIFREANLGVSYVPMTPFYDVQPVTKTFEYLLAGMPVIATRTSENAKVINPANGVLIEDDPESFAAGLANVAGRLATFDSLELRRTSRSYTWSHIIDTIMAPYLLGVIRNRR